MLTRGCLRLHEEYVIRVGAVADDLFAAAFAQDGRPGRVLLGVLASAALHARVSGWEWRGGCSSLRLNMANDASLVNLELGAPPPAELIYGDWYPALRAEELRKGRTTTALLMGIPMLLGRKNDGNIFAMRDLCPHRGIPLSAGWFDGETVQCKYHGWRFEPCSGQCREIPSLTGAGYPGRD